jgi:hypothetical protein
MERKEALIISLTSSMRRSRETSSGEKGTKGSKQRRRIKDM